MPTRTSPDSPALAAASSVESRSIPAAAPDRRARMPRQVYFGDGGIIPDETMAIIGQAYEDCAVRFEWRKGDVVMLDNMLAAHARDPFEGPRKIVVAMGAMFNRADLTTMEGESND